MSQSFFDRLMSADGATKEEEQALQAWVVRDSHGVCLNDRGWPYGRPYRQVAEELAACGITNGAGRALHPFQLKQLIARAITKKTYSLVGEKHDAEAKRRLYSEVWRALKRKRCYRRKKSK